MAHTKKLLTHDVMFSVRLPREVVEELRDLKERVGIPVAEQLRRALALWFASQKKAKR